MLRMRLSLEGRLELPVESFDHAVGDGMICCGSSSVPNSCVSCSHILDSNCRPRSVVMVEGTPKREIHPLINAVATVSAVMSGIGITSGQRVNRSIHVSIYV